MADRTVRAIVELNMSNFVTPAKQGEDALNRLAAAGDKASAAARKVGDAADKAAAGAGKQATESGKAADASSRVADAYGKAGAANARYAAEAGKSADASAKQGAAAEKAASATKSAGDATADMGGKSEGARARLMGLHDTLRGTSSESVKVEESAHRIGMAMVAMSAAVVGAGVVIAKTYADYDAAMSKVASTGAEAKAAMGALREASMAHADLGFTATQAAEGEEALLKAGLGVTDVVHGGLRGALALASAGEMSVGDAAETASMAMTQFKLEGKDVAHIADLLAAGAGKAQGDVKDLAMGMKQGGLVASQFGISIEETVGTMSAFASAGLLGSDAGTSFKTMLLKLASPAKEAQGVMDQLGIEMYDANGKFIGVAGAADQLRKGMSKLTDAERQNALATIFGTDAIRAASILYEQGGSGIREWTKAVDDSGYAAAMAADKTNNLQGDLNKFKAAMEKSIIQGGGGLNSALRDMVQGATSLVGVLDKIPAGVTLGFAGTAAALAGTVASVSAAVKAFEAFRDAKRVIDELKDAFPGLANQLEGLGGRAFKSGALIAAGLVAATEALHAMQRQTDEAVASMARGDEMGAALRQMGEGAKEVAVEMTGLTQSTATGANALDKFFTTANYNFGTMSHSMVSGVDSLSSAMSALHREASASGFDKGFADMVGGIFGVKTPLQELTAMFGQIDGELMKLGSSAERSTAFAKIAEQAHAAKVSDEELLAVMPKMSEEFVKTATDLGLQGDKFKGTSLSAAEYVDWMGGKVPPAVQAAVDATGQHKEVIDQDALSVTQLRQRLQELTDQVVGHAKNLVAASSAESNFYAAIDKATAATLANKQGHIEAAGGLDYHTEAGRRNHATLDGLITSTGQFIKVMHEQGKNVEEVRAKLDEGKEAYIRTAVAMGAPEEEARRLANEIFKIPTEHDTKITTHADLSGVNSALAGINSVQDKQVIIRTLHEDVYSSVHSGSGERGPRETLAYGGPVGGYSWHDRADNIPAMLTAGEFVLDRPAVRRVGLSKLFDLLAGRADVVPRRAYAYGGHVTPAPAPARPTILQRAQGYAYGGPVAAAGVAPTFVFSPQVSEHLSLLRQWQQFTQEAERWIAV